MEKVRLNLLQLMFLIPKSRSDAKKIAFSIANSPLVKTAIAGEIQIGGE